MKQGQSESLFSLDLSNFAFPFKDWLFSSGTEISKYIYSFALPDMSDLLLL